MEDIPEMEVGLTAFFEDHNEYTDDPQQFTKKILILMILLRYNFEH